MATALISLGSNLGYREATLNLAVQKLAWTPCISGVLVSSYRPTKPVGGPPGQEEFLNAAVRLETPLSPRDLLTQMQRIEHELGRIREEHWGPRTIDLDLLLYDDLVINEPDLIVPHRFLPFRRFVLEPAVEVAGKMRHPEIGMQLKTLLARLPPFPQVYEVGGLITSVRREFAQRIATRFGFAIAKRDVAIHPDTGRAEVKASFRTHDGKPLDRTRVYSFIAEDSYGELIYQPGLVEPLNWPQLKQDLLSRSAASFPSVALFQLDASNDWLRKADPNLALLGDRADTHCNEFRNSVDRACQVLHLPKLDLPADDLDRAVREAVAAIQAMQ